MRREPLVYAVLVVAALGVAFRTWTHEERAAAAPGAAVAWHERADALVSVELTQPGHHVLIRRLDPDGTPYLWATTDTSQFLVSDESGPRLVDALAVPQALRDLGVPNARERRDYGLDTTRTRVVIRFGKRTRELLVGAPTYYTGDRYVLAQPGDHAYVLPQATLAPFDSPEQLLMQHKLHTFSQERVAAVTLSAGGRTWSMHRLGPAGAPKGPVPPAGAWAPLTGPQQPNVAYATFLQRVDGLWAAGYAPRQDPRALSPVLRLDYTDARGHALGYLELFRRPGQAPVPEFFARTETTRVLVRLFPGSADNLANDLAQGVLGAAAPAPRA